MAMLVIGLLVMAYRGAIHEFQILQRDYAPDTDWNELIKEQLPIVIRELPKPWLGNWTRAKTEQKTWVLQVHDAQGQQFRTTWAHWLTSRQHTPTNMPEIGAVAKLQTALEYWHIAGFRHWSWLPAGIPVPAVISTDTEGIRKTVAEYTAIVATDGVPIDMWIAHEGAIPATVASDLEGKDPWIQTSDTIPWIGEVKFVEIKLRPGNAVILPRHWWYALKSSEHADAWYWTGYFHTPISWAVSKIKPKN